MPKKLFDLTDDDMAALERVRVKRGDRSHAETLRQLVRLADLDQAITLRAMPVQPATWPSGAVLLPEHTADPGPAATSWVAIPKSPPNAIDVVRAARPAKAVGGVDIPLHKPKAFNPQPKTGKPKR